MYNDLGIFYVLETWRVGSIPTYATMENVSRISKIYTSCSNPDPKDEGRKTAYLIICEFDEAFNAGKFTEIDQLLLDIDVDKLSTQGVHSILVCSLWAKDKLQNIKQFHDKGYIRCLAIADEERINKLFKKFKGIK